VPKGYRHVFHQYTVRVADGHRDVALEGLKERGIGAGVYYPVPVHQQRVYVEQGYTGTFPEAERAATEVLSLPVHPGLSRADLETIVVAVNELCG
jgi:perosamine synthetase